MGKAVAATPRRQANARYQRLAAPDIRMLLTATTTRAAATTSRTARRRPLVRSWWRSGSWVAAMTPAVVELDFSALHVSARKEGSGGIQSSDESTTCAGANVRFRD